MQLKSDYYLLLDWHASICCIFDPPPGICIRYSSWCNYVAIFIWHNSVNEVLLHTFCSIVMDAPRGSDGCYPHEPFYRCKKTNAAGARTTTEGMSPDSDGCYPHEPFYRCKKTRAAGARTTAMEEGKRHFGEKDEVEKQAVAKRMKRQ